MRADWSDAERVGALHHHRAEVAHVEHDRARAAGPVLGQRAGLVGQRHVPPPEGDELGAEGAVGGVERRGPGRHPGEPIWAAAADGLAEGGERGVLLEPEQRDGRLDLLGDTVHGEQVQHALALVLVDHVDQVLAVPHEDHAVAGDDELGGGEVLAEVPDVLEGGPHPLELLPGVEEGLDHLQLDQVLVRVAATAPAPLRVGQSRADQVRAGPVVELAVGDADDVGRFASAESVSAHRVLLPCCRCSRWWVSRTTPMELHRCRAEARVRPPARAVNGQLPKRGSPGARLAGVPAGGEGDSTADATAARRRIRALLAAAVVIPLVGLTAAWQDDRGAREATDPLPTAARAAPGTLDDLTGRNWYVLDLAGR